MYIIPPEVICLTLLRQEVCCACVFALARTGNPRGAAEHLALAAAMRPDLRHYTDALRHVRATLRSRARREGAS